MEFRAKSLVFSWRARQTWRRGTSNAAARRQRAPLPSQNSLAALQGWQNCPQMRHRARRHERRCSISSQRRSAGVTPPPLITCTNRKRLLLSPDKRSRVGLHVAAARHCRTRRNKMALEANAKNRSCMHRISHIARTTHIARLAEFTLHTAHHDGNCFRISYSHRHWIAISRLVGEIFQSSLQASP